MIVCLAVSQALFFVVFMAHEWLLAFSANEMLYMPVFSQRRYNPLLDGPTAGSTNWNAHLIMASEAIQVALNLARFRCQLNAAGRTVEMVCVVRFVAPLQWLVVDNSMAFVADMLSDSGRLFPSIAFMTECPVCVLDKATISKAATADFATKASRMPAFVHSFDHPTDDEFVAFSTGRRIQHVEIVFTVFSALELIENAVRERPKTVRADEARLMPGLPVRVDDFFVRLEAFPTAMA